ncbi:MAG: amidohydrolase, partial [Clostridiales Family XIII bacterium]|nr:amidohydrolase [Clostridiales Family XIII bacterium]
MKAKTIFYNGPVLTVDGDDRVCEAAAVAGDRIVAVGSAEAVKALADEDTRLIDLRGRSLIPGIIDAHEHTAIRGLNALSVDCRPSSVRSIEEIKEKIREAAANTPKGQWIRGWGYNDTALAEKRHPNRWDLDEAAPDHPVILTRVCAHISAHNSRSLAAAGVAEDAAAPQGGAFERIDGKLSGVMFENAHMFMMRMSSPSEKELIDAMLAVDAMLVAEGITTVHDSGGYGAVQMRAMQEAARSGRLSARYRAMVFSFVDNVGLVNDYLRTGICTGLGDDSFRLGPIKLMIDGSSSGPTAATRAPYASNAESRGIMSMEQDCIDDIVLRAHRGGWQVTCHAVGDRAIDAILTAMERANAACPRTDHRHRIEHCAMMDEGLMKRVAALGVVPVPQPVFLYEFGDGYVKNYGEERGAGMFPCASFLRNGIVAAGSSDCPITWSDPFLNMHTAVNRRTQTGALRNENECISVPAALRMFTRNGAYAAFEEGIKGSIEPGKLADLVVLSTDLLGAPKESIKDIRADLTMIGGKIVYTRAEA